MAYNFDPLERDAPTARSDESAAPRLLIAIGAIAAALGVYRLWGLDGVLLAGGAALAALGVMLLVLRRLMALLRGREVARSKRQH